MTGMKRGWERNPDVKRCPGCNCLVSVGSYPEHAFFCDGVKVLTSQDGRDLYGRFVKRKDLIGIPK
jgi:hypothetical protein